MFAFAFAALGAVVEVEAGDTAVVVEEEVRDKIRGGGGGRGAVSVFMLESEGCNVTR